MPKCSKPTKRKTKPKIVSTDNTDVVVLGKLVDKLFDQIAELKATNKEHEKKINEIIGAMQTVNTTQDDWELPKDSEDPAKDELDSMMESL